MGQVGDIAVKGTDTASDAVKVPFAARGYGQPAMRRSFAETCGCIGWPTMARSST